MGMSPIAPMHLVMHTISGFIGLTVTQVNRVLRHSRYARQAAQRQGQELETRPEGSQGSRLLLTRGIRTGGDVGPKEYIHYQDIARVCLH